LSNASTYQLNARGHDSILNLAQNWNEAEFNIVGDTCGKGSQASFKPGGTIVVRTSVDDGTTIAPCPRNPTPPYAPICAIAGTTAETNNLNLGTCSCIEGPGTTPAIVFTESNTVAATGPDLAAWRWCYERLYTDKIAFNAIIKNVGSSVWKPSTTGYLKIGVTSGPNPLGEVSHENPCTLDAYPNFPALDPGMEYAAPSCSIMVDFNESYYYDLGPKLFVLYHPEDTNPANDELVIQHINEKGKEFLPGGKLYDHRCH
jgi:hypothetical protein